MEHARNIILQTERANRLKYYLSIAQKQNDSGIFYNQRIFFLLSEHHIGYLSTVNTKLRPQELNFQKAKKTVLLGHIKGVGCNENILRIRFNNIEGTKIDQRVWLMRFNNQKLCRIWYEVIEKERIQSTLKKEKKDEFIVIEEEKAPQFVEPVQQKKPLQLVSKNMQVAQKIRLQKQTKQMGTSVSPKNSTTPIRPNYHNQLSQVLMTPNTNSKAVSLSPEYPTQNIPQLSKQISNNSKNQSDSQLSQSKRNRSQSPLAKWYQEEEVSPVYRINNQRYIKDSGNGEKDIMRRSNFQQFQRSRLSLPRNDFDQYQAMTQKSPTFPTSHPIFTSFPSPSPPRRLPASSPFKIPSIPWTFRYLKHSHKIFPQFQKYTQLLLLQLISDLSRPVQQKKYKMKMLKNGISFYDVGDVQVKLAFIARGTEQSARGQEGNRGKDGIRSIRNQFKNYMALYQYLGDSVLLRVPLVSICQYQGFTALFKVLSKPNPSSSLKSTSTRLQSQLLSLSSRSKISLDFFSSNINRVIIQLDSVYYSKFKQSQQDKNLNFNLFMIQEIDHYLLPDLAADQERQYRFVVRKELMRGFSSSTGRPVKGQLAIHSSRRNDVFEQRQNTRQLQRLSKNLLSSRTQTSQQLDNSQIYFMTSSQLSSYLHSKGINIRYLGVLYQSLKCQYFKNIIMAQIAARSCKYLLRKTIQQIVLQDQVVVGENLFMEQIADFLNLVLGNTYQSAQFWQEIVNSTSKTMFNVDIKIKQIDKAYFIGALVDNCRLKVSWSNIKVQQVFKSTIFFNETNLKGMNFTHKIYQPIYSQYYNLSKIILQSQQSRQGFDQLISYLNLKTKTIPQHLHNLKPQINKYLAYFIPPNQKQFQHLDIYSHNRQQERPNKIMCQIMLIQLKWYLKHHQKQQYIKHCTLFIQKITNYHNQFHPILTNLYDIFSTYYLINNQYQDSLTFAKSSLVNTLKIFTSTHKKTSQCYYHLALCYIKANKNTEAMVHLQKARMYFEGKRKQDNIQYGIIMNKMGMLLLGDNRVEEALEVTVKALNVFQNRQDGEFQDQITECYEIMARCYQLLNDKEEIKELGEHCLGRLQNVQNTANLQKMIKIYLYPHLSTLPPASASLYIDLLSSLPIPENTEQALSKLKTRLNEQNLKQNFQAYLQKLPQIDRHIRQRDVLKNWQSNQMVYPRETVNDFVSLNEEFMALLGEGYLVGCLRQAL